MHADRVARSKASRSMESDLPLATSAAIAHDSRWIACAKLPHAAGSPGHALPKYLPSVFGTRGSDKSADHRSHTAAGKSLSTAVAIKRCCSQKTNCNFAFILQNKILVRRCFWNSGLAAGACYKLACLVNTSREPAGQLVDVRIKKHSHVVAWDVMQLHRTSDYITPSA